MPDNQHNFSRLVEHFRPRKEDPGNTSDWPITEYTIVAGSRISFIVTNGPEPPKTRKSSVDFQQLSVCWFHDLFIYESFQIFFLSLVSYAYVRTKKHEQTTNPNKNMCVCVVCMP